MRRAQVNAYTKRRHKSLSSKRRASATLLSNPTLTIVAARRHVFHRLVIGFAGQSLFPAIPGYARTPAPQPWLLQACSFSLVPRGQGIAGRSLQLVRILPFRCNRWIEPTPGRYACARRPRSSKKANQAEAQPVNLRSS